MRVRIRNFQSLGQVDLNIEGLTVIVGQSNLGKSALIRAVSAAFFGQAGDYFVRLGAQQSDVEIYDAPKVGGGTFNIEWHKGKGVNYFVVDGVKYDKVARDVPDVITDAGYRDIAVGDEYLRPQVSNQHDRTFLLDRAGSFVHDIISQASRLSVLLRADRSCASDLKRQKQVQKIRQADLEEANTKLEALKPIREFYVRVHALKPKVKNLRTLANKLEDLREISHSRALLIGTKDLTLPQEFIWPESTIEPLYGKLHEVRLYAQERKLYVGLPEAVPSARPFDFDGMAKMATDIELAKQLASQHHTMLREVIEAEASKKSISQEAEASEAELAIELATLTICPVCEQPMPKIPDAEVHTH